MKANKLIPLLRRGDGSTLSLDFTAMSSLDSRFTFSRASTTSTFINSSGLVATAGTNVARFDHDPTTLAPRGLLIEGSVTNLVLQSDTLPTPTNWVANAITRTNVSTVTPDGNTTATTCGLSHTGSGSFRSSNITVTASTAYTFSFWAKNNGGSVALYRAYNVSGSADIVAETSYFSQINGSTWTRVQFNFTTPVGCTSVYVYPLSQSSGTSNVLIWGAQLEAGSGATSYIPTGSSTVQRAAESCSMTGTNFSSWYNTSEGTVLAKWRQFNVHANEFATAVRFTVAPGTANTLWIGKQNTAGVGRRIEFEIRDPSGTQRLASAANPVTDPTITAAGAQKFGGTFGISYNGNTTVSSVQTSSPAPDRLFIGSYDATSGQINSTIARLVYWPTRLPDATLQSLTQ